MFGDGYATFSRFESSSGAFISSVWFVWAGENTAITTSTEQNNSLRLLEIGCTQASHNMVQLH